MDVSPKVHTLPATNEFVQLSNQEVKLLIDRYVDGDSEAIAPLMEMIRPMVYSDMAGRKIPPNVDREDVVSELTLIVLDSLPGYNPNIASFSTFAFHIIHRRMARIITSLSGARVLESGKASQQQFPEHLDIFDTSDPGMSLEDYELHLDATAIIRIHLTPYQCRVYLDYLQNMPTTVIAERANAYADTINPNHQLITNVDINETIAECTRKIKEEFRQRGVLSSATGELQKDLF